MKHRYRGKRRRHYGGQWYVKAAHRFLKSLTSNVKHHVPCGPYIIYRYILHHHSLESLHD